MTEKRSTYHHGDLRKALIEAADGIIAEGGIEAFSLRAAAQRAGVSPGAPARRVNLPSAWDFTDTSVCGRKRKLSKKQQCSQRWLRKSLPKVRSGRQGSTGTCLPQASLF